MSDSDSSWPMLTPIRWGDLVQRSTLLQEMDCYGLPYGGLGFLSHFLTFYSIACLWFARKSLWPFRPVKYGKFDFVLGLVGFLVSTAMTIRTMVNCHHAWQFVLIAIGNLSMSALSGVTAITVCSLIISNPKEESKLTRFGTLWMFFRKSYKFEIPSISVNNLMNYFCCRSPLHDHRARWPRLCDISGCILSASLPSLDQIDRRILRNNWDPGIVLPPSNQHWLYKGFRHHRPICHRLAHHFLR